MADACPSTTLDEDSYNAFRDYLERRELVDLSRFHPQWYFTNEEIERSEDLLKRDGTPICIPPSWDLVQKYAGASDENADGFDKELYETGKVNYLGDQGEAEFLDVVRNSKIGGVLIGNINSQHLLYGRQLDPKEKEYYMMPNLIMDKLQKEVGDFEIDFLFFHETGIQHFEVKQIQKNKRTVVTKLVKDARTQIAQKHRPALERLFRLFCKIYGGTVKTFIPWEHIFCKKSIIYLTGEKANDQFQHIEGNELSTIVHGKENLESVLMEKYHRNETDSNLFKSSHLYRNFLIFLATYRPDFFISPVQCALRVRENIFKHRVNRENFYCKNPNESVQNVAMTVKDFLSTMPSFINKSIKFGLYHDIYLTEQQRKAVGHVHEDGEFCPNRQLIFGPAGSGKSLILMLQVFILVQIRSNVALFFLTHSELHRSKLSEFVEENKTPTWRNVRMEGYLVHTKQYKPYDLIRDEGHALNVTFDAEMFSSENKENVFTCVVTGYVGDQTNAEQFFKGQHYAPIDEQSVRESFKITELGTVFRSSKQIQVLLRSVYSEMDTAIVSGHNFDGVKVEIHNFENKGLMMDAVKQRINRLIDIEQCKPIEIGLFYPDLYVIRFPQIPESNNLRSVSRARSMEYPVMIVVDCYAEEFYLMASRTICHLIIFSTVHDEGQRPVLRYRKKQIARGDFPF